MVANWYRGKYWLITNTFLSFLMLSALRFIYCSSWNQCFLFILDQHRGSKSCLIWHSTSSDPCKNRLVVDSNQKLSILYYIQKMGCQYHFSNSQTEHNNWTQYRLEPVEFPSDPEKWVLCIFLRLNETELWS